MTKQRYKTGDWIQITEHGKKTLDRYQDSACIDSSTIFRVRYADDDDHAYVDPWMLLERITETGKLEPIVDIWFIANNGHGDMFVPYDMPAELQAIYALSRL